MYDSFLYGYGLNLAISHKIASVLPKRKTQYLFFNDFFHEFIAGDENLKIYKDFLKYFDIDSNTIKMHEDTKRYLASKKEEISSYGFERWVSKYLFDEKSKVTGTVKFYIYILYNYWAHIVNANILPTQQARIVLQEFADTISMELNDKNKTFTTNFDFFLDQYLSPHHIHGFFSLPLRNIKEIILPGTLTRKEFEYVYLFGTNGFEKLSRLDKIRQLTQAQYQLDFFYDLDLDLGHLLIYGLSFGLGHLLPKEFLDQHPEYKEQFLITSVDGHILIKLSERYQKKKLSHITMSYHTNDDLEQLKYIISMTDLAPITEYKHSNEIFSL